MIEQGMAAMKRALEAPTRGLPRVLLSASIAAPDGEPPEERVAKPQVPKTVELVRGYTLLGTIDVKPGEGDLPWHSGTFHPLAEFEAVRELFERELRLLRANTADDPGQWEEWEAVHAELHDPGMRLQSADKSWMADEILIHIDGQEAWWRIGAD
ncbi:MAG: hypothetical protein ACXWG3_19425 [Usitatibacter sp.]